MEWFIAALQDGPGNRETALAALRVRLGEATVAHLLDLDRYALRHEPYDHDADRSSVRDLPVGIESILRRAPKGHRPTPQEFTVRIIRFDPDLAQAYSVFKSDDPRLHLVGPFYSAHTMLKAIAVRIERLREAAESVSRERR